MNARIVFVIGVSLFAGACRALAGEHYYSYYKERIPLGVDSGQIAVFRADSTMPDEGALASLGIGDATAVPRVAPGWFDISFPDLENGAADLASLVAIAAQSGEVGFVSPIFRDSTGLPCLIKPDILVGFAEGVTDDDAEWILLSAGASEILDRDWNRMPGVYRVRTGTKNGLEVLRIANDLADHAEVVFSEPLRVTNAELSLIPNDEYFFNLWAFNNTGQLGGLVDADMNCTQAWDAPSGFGAASIRVLVMDSGIQQNHPDISQSPGMDFTGQNSPGGGPFNAQDNHGTAVGGCVSATANNTIGVCGSAPGVRAVSARIGITAPDGQHLENDIAAAMVTALTWAETNNIRVTNASVGIGLPSAPLDLKYAQTRAGGMIHFVASGNGAEALPNVVSYPATLPSVIAVGAIQQFGQRTAFSQYGPELDIVAPGQLLLTTDRTGSAGYDPSDYTFMGGNGIQGTSFASPYAAGVAALVLSANPSLTPDQVQSILQSTARDLGAPGFDNQYGHGLVRADAAVAAAGGGGGAPANNNCASATALVSGVTTTGSTANATTDGSATCVLSGKDVWFTFTPTQSGTVTINTCGAAFDTVLSVYTGACGALTQVGCNDDNLGQGPCSGQATTSYLSLAMTAGTAYRIRLAGYNDGTTTASGNYSILLTAPGGSGPANDNCANATPLISGIAATGSTANATTDGSPTQCDGPLASGKDVWFTYTPAQSGNVTIQTCGSFDTVLSIYTGACGALTLTGCNDQTPPNGPCPEQPDTSYLAGTVTGGTQYRIRLAGYNNQGTIASGNYSILLTGPGGGGGTSGSDNCVNAVLLTPGVPATGSNVNATDDPVAFSVCVTFASARDVWFRYIPACSGLHTIDTCGSDFDTLVSVHTGPCSVDIFTFPEIGCNDDALVGPCSDPPTGPSRVSLNMTAGVEYRIFLASHGLFDPPDGGNYTLLLTGPGGAAPPAPTNVAATDSLCDRVTVSWSASAGATGYQVWRSTINDSGTAQQVGTPAASPYNDLAAVAGTQYYYWVRATATCGASGFSTGNDGIRLATPAAPTNVAATDALCDRVTVSWSAAAGATGYLVWRNTTNNSATATQIGTPAASPYNDLTAASGTAYFYWVKATSLCGASPFSASDAGLRSSTPASPTGVLATDGTNCSAVQVSWNAVSGATSYQVWRNSVNNSVTAQQIASPTASPHLDTTADPNTTYYFWVKSVGPCGASGFSASDAGLRCNVPTCPGARGDANCDGLVNFFDIDPFVMALFNLPAYQTLFCGGNICAVDTDCSEVVNFFDIDAFLDCQFDGCGPCP